MLTLLATFALAGPVAAQTPQPDGPAKAAPDKPEPGKNSGVGPVTKNPGEIDKGQNMILPSAGQSGESAAPTMVYDCKNKPQDCIVQPGKGDKASVPTQSTPKR